MNKSNLTFRRNIILALIPASVTIVVALITYHPWRKDIQKPNGENNKCFLSGTVVDASSNNSIPQAEIVVVGRNEQYVSESNGNFKIPFKDSITHVRIHVEKKSYVPYDKSYDLPSSDIIIQLIHK
ncbi:MAG: carboxypeptidase-like regulatory domain-containing protein [Bacteroidetes bacterium]|nr:carboxypeptidase-like regulatory domain-containing protein [Bacteroidota bacterium]